ncbi:Transcriptional repressor scratch 2 [Operophtera brumata]|uniref:Transcriptional repressor scratch 2 n=1 Tax=Operophtera brumata TaxID=104452 RepID=A0A0L7L4H2_OPEBR|nr:Transcriptional repressor scratch 2 [Operophtera brumata]
MSALTVCRVCLLDNIRMQSIQNTELQELFEILAHNKVTPASVTLLNGGTPLNISSATLQPICFYNFPDNEDTLEVEYSLTGGVKQETGGYPIEYDNDFDEEVKNDFTGDFSLDEVNLVAPSTTEIKEENSGFHNKNNQIFVASTNFKEEQEFFNQSSDENVKIRHRKKCSMKKRGKIESMKNLKSRRKKNNVEDTCIICEISFSDPGRYRAHMRQHARHPRPTCTFCDKIFADKLPKKSHEDPHGRAREKQT